MHLLLAELAANTTRTGTLLHDVTNFLVHHGCPRTAAHSLEVADAARHLAARYGTDADAAEAAGWLHDISAIIPVSERVRYAEAWGIEVLPEERQVPLIVHQKLSAYIAQHIFEIADAKVISAIGCHTTLRAGASQLDKIVFIADKIEWDGRGEPPYRAELAYAAQHSIDAATTWFLSYLWQRRETLLVLHPWLVAAYEEVLSIHRSFE